MAWPGAPASPSWRRRWARAANSLVRSGNRSRGIAPSAKASIWPGSRMRRMSDLAEPGPVMLPRPARRHGAPEHGMQRALYPDRGVDVQQDRADQDERAHGLPPGGEANHPDWEVKREIDAPDDEAGQQQAEQAGADHEEQQLLSCVVAPDFREMLFAIVHHVLQLPQPLPIGGLHAVVAPNGRREQQEHDHHEQSDERVQDPRPGAAAEQIAEPEQGRMKQREPRQRREQEREGNQPVIGALAGAVAPRSRAAFVVAHGRLSAPALGGAVRCCAASRACRAAASSRSSTSLRPTRTKWKKPASAVNAMAASAIGLEAPFQSPTSKLRCGSGASPAYSCG